MEHLTVRASDGLSLAVEDAGPRHGTARSPLLCLAGLTRTKADFYALRDHFAFHPTTPRRVVLMDTRGRGGSDRAPEASTYTVQVEANDAVQVACALGLEHTVVVGTSRGGMLAMVMSVARPGMLRASVLNDIGPRIAGAGLGRLKRQLRSMHLPDTWDAAALQVRSAMQAQFPAFNDEDWARYARQTFANVGGKPAQAFDPAILAPLADIPDGLPFLDLSAPFKALACRPTLLLHGEHSDLLDADGLRLAQGFGTRTHTVAGQGHAPALRGEPLAVIDAFLQDNAL